MSYSPHELEILKRTRLLDFGLLKMYKDLWQRAFTEYNFDHPKDRPLGLHCRSCYMKVYTHLKQKYEIGVDN